MLGEKVGDPMHGLPFQSEARNAASKLLANLPTAIRSRVSDLSDHLHVSLEPIHGLPDAQMHYQRLLQAIEKRHKIRLTYHSLHEHAEISTLLSPYLVYFQKRTWYVIGRSSLHREVRIDSHRSNCGVCAHG